MRTLSFPTINKVKLSHFSLYTLVDPIEISLESGISCLVGANGLGKSTFLQIINYALTGTVPKPDQKFVSVGDYYRDILTFTSGYFLGRIRPEHKETAEVELDLNFGSTRVVLRRGFFESKELRALTIYEDGKQKTFPNHPPEKLHEEFEKLVTYKVGLDTFNEFVFVQSFVLTFDERRQLLFWDPKILETCLLIFMGVDNKQRANAETLRRDMERAESKVRNLVYDIKQEKDRLEDLTTALKGKAQAKKDEKTRAEYMLLLERFDTAEKGVAELDAKILDAKLTIADSAARMSALRIDYKTEFELRLNAKHTAASHPLIKKILLEEKCEICGAEGATVSSEINAAIKNNKCPLCDAADSTKAENPKTIARLKELDSLIAKEHKTLDSQTLLIKHLEQSRTKLVAEKDSLEKTKKDFEEAHHDVAAGTLKNSKDLEHLRKIHERNIANLTKEKDEYKALSQKKALAYKQVQNRLETQYLETRKTFVPAFNTLAKLFLGVDLDISLETREKSVTLVLEVKKTKRRAEHELSESQRFFIDIALRMAFAQFASAPGAKTPLYIDTPEGSLDLAYEAQAGQMIAQFATDGHRTFMTANINTSQLLHSIAGNSGKCGLTLHRLYKWTELSEVQELQEKKFDLTMNKLEKLAHQKN